MLKEFFSPWVNQLILWWYEIKGIAAKLMVVSILQRGPSLSFLHPAVLQYLCQGKLSSVNHESTLKAAVKVNK